jgi:ribosomal protein S18 acetylase RimI-like enzyme
MVLAGTWNLPALAIADFFAQVADHALAPDCPARYLVGRAAQQPISTAEVFIHAGVAGIYNIATLPEFRGRGYGTAMTLAALRTAREAGCAYAVLQATHAGESVYRRAGFAPFGHLTEFAV